MQFDVITLFPDMFAGYLKQSLLHKAIENGLVQVNVFDLRDWSKDKHHSVDDRPFGGGPGMVLKVDTVVECVEAIIGLDPQASESERLCSGKVVGSTRSPRIVLTSPQGQRLDQRLVEELAKEQRILLLCGRYEGFDQRVIDILQPMELSIGDFVLNGGEVAAMVVIDTVVRLIPGVLGDERSNVEDSFSSGNRMLEFAQYTRPREYRGFAVPDILLSGDHPRIAQWRKQKSLENTLKKRADLLDDDQARPHDENE